MGVRGIRAELPLCKAEGSWSEWHLQSQVGQNSDFLTGSGWALDGGHLMGYRIQSRASSDHEHKATVGQGMCVEPPGGCRVEARDLGSSSGSARVALVCDVTPVCLVLLSRKGQWGREGQCE